MSELTEQRHAVTNQFQPKASARAEPVAGCQLLRRNDRTRPRRFLGLDGDDGSKRSRHTLSRASPSGHATGFPHRGCLLLLPSCRRTSGSVALGCMDCAWPRARPAADTSRVRVASRPSRHREPAAGPPAAGAQVPTRGAEMRAATQPPLNRVSQIPARRSLRPASGARRCDLAQL